MMIETKDCRWTLVAIALAIVGCGGGDGDSATAATSQTTPTVPSPTVPNTPAATDVDGTPSATDPTNIPVATDPSALSVQGVPAAAASIGAKYSFQPTVTDADGGKLTFDIANKPGWATFSTTTGQLLGTPTPGDVGTNANIVIQVTDGQNFTTLPVFSITVPAVALGSATLSWLPPTRETDGSPLAKVGSYKVYWGTAMDDLANSDTIQNGLTRYVVENLAPGKYFFVMTAFDPAGVESARSATAIKTIV
jgi:hypothetical protein